MLVTQSNQILTAIIHGMRQSEPSNHVRLAATTALHNSLEFTRANFDKEVRINSKVFSLNECVVDVYMKNNIFFMHFSPTAYDFIYSD